jgi:hypothetical protein
VTCNDKTDQRTDLDAGQVVEVGVGENDEEVLHRLVRLELLGGHHAAQPVVEHHWLGDDKERRGVSMAGG